jgi:septal ring factor EnvC (AmiA/AmiB activator)
MINRIPPKLVAPLIILTLIVAGGCEESNQSQIKQARLTVQENIELKQQIESLQEEIQKQKDLFAQAEKEHTETMKQTGESTIKIMKTLAETAKKNEALTQEIAVLKKRIEELESQLDKSAAD